MSTNDVTETAVPASITTPSNVETRIGTLEFTDGYPTGATAAKLRDHLDYLHGVEAFTNSIQGVSTYALREGFLSAGIADGDVAIFSQLLDSRTLLLTGNADTVYFMTFVDLSNGPLVIDTPSDTLGIVDDMWFRWVSDFGLPGPDRGRGGTYLLVPPGYEGPLPEGGQFVLHSRTNHLLVLGRAFVDENEGNDPAPTVARIKQQMKIYPYAPGGFGNSIGGYLTGRGGLGQLAEAHSPRFVESTGLAFNTIPPNDFGHYELLDALVQLEPAEALDTELAGQFAAIGIVKGEKFAPEPRLREILDEAVAIGNAAARTLGLGAHPTEAFRLYDDDTAWWNMLWVGGFEFTNPPPQITTGRHPAVPEHRCPPAALSDLVLLHRDRHHPSHVHAADQRRVAIPHGQHRHQRKTLRRRQDLPPEPAERHPSSPVLVAHALRQPDPLYAADPPALPPGRKPGLPVAGSSGRGGRIDRRLLRARPARRRRGGNWIQTDPEKGWFVCLRLYSPLQTFFDNTWRPSEIEPVD